MKGTYNLVYYKRHFMFSFQDIYTLKIYKFGQQVRGQRERRAAGDGGGSVTPADFETAACICNHL